MADEEDIVLKLKVEDELSPAVKKATEVLASSMGKAATTAAKTSKKVVSAQEKSAKSGLALFEKQQNLDPSVKLKKDLKSLKAALDKSLITREQHAAAVKKVLRRTATAAQSTAKKIKGTNKEIKGSFLDVFKGNVAANAAVAAFSMMAGAAKSAFNTIISGSIAAANAQQIAVKKMNNALALFGDFSTEASESMLAFTDELERNTGVGQDVLLNQIALAKSFGGTNEQTQQLTKAAVDLAEATGITLVSATRTLGKTLAGTIGLVGEAAPELRTLSKAALESGAAIDIILQKFGGSAAAQVKTFTGGIKQLENAFGGIQEEIGNAIIKNQAIINVLGVAGEMFQEFEQLIKDNQKAISLFVAQGVLGLIDAFALLITVADSVGRIINVAFNTAKLSVNGLGLAVSGVLSIVSDDAKIAFKAFEETSIETANNITNAFSADTFLTGVNDQLARLKGAAQAGFNAMQSGADGAADSVKNGTRALEDQREVFIKNAQIQFEVRDKELKLFQDFLDAKGRMAISAEQEQAQQLLAVRAELSGDSPEGFELKRQLAQEQFDLDMQQKIAQAEVLGLSEMEVRALREQAQLEHFVNLKDMEIAHFAKQADLREKQGDDWGAFLENLRKMRKKHGAIMGTLLGIEQSKQFQTVNQGLSNLSTLRDGHSKKAFKVGKAAAIAQASISMISSTVKAFDAMVGIPIVGPVLAVAAAGAALAAGTIQIQKLTAQRFQGGQGDASGLR